MSHPGSPQMSPRKGKYMAAKIYMLDDTVQVFHIPVSTSHYCWLREIAYCLSYTVTKVYFWGTIHYIIAGSERQLILLWRRSISEALSTILLLAVRDSLLLELCRGEGRFLRHYPLYHCLAIYYCWCSRCPHCSLKTVSWGISWIFSTFDEYLAGVLFSDVLFPFNRDDIPSQPWRQWRNLMKVLRRFTRRCARYRALFWRGLILLDTNWVAKKKKKKKETSLDCLQEHIYIKNNKQVNFFDIAAVHR